MLWRGLGGIQQDSSAEGLEPRNSTLAKISTTAMPVNQGTAVGWSMESKNKHTFPTSWCLIWGCIWTSHRTTELWFHIPYSTGHPCQWLRPSGARSGMQEILWSSEVRISFLITIITSNGRWEIYDWQCNSSKKHLSEHLLLLSLSKNEK